MRETISTNRKDNDLKRDEGHEIHKSKINTIDVN